MKIPSFLFFISGGCSFLSGVGLVCAPSAMWIMSTPPWDSEKERGVEHPHRQTRNARPRSRKRKWSLMKRDDDDDVSYHQQAHRCSQSPPGEKKGEILPEAHCPISFRFFFFCGCVPELKKNVSTTHIFLFLIDCFIWKVGIFCVQRWVVRSSPVHLFKFRNAFLFGHWYALHTVVWLSISLDLKGFKKKIKYGWLGYL